MCLSEQGHLRVINLSDLNPFYQCSCRIPPITVWTEHPTFCFTALWVSWDLYCILPLILLSRCLYYFVKCLFICVMYSIKSPNCISCHCSTRLVGVYCIKREAHTCRYLTSFLWIKGSGSALFSLLQFSIDYMNTWLDNDLSHRDISFNNSPGWNKGLPRTL